MNTRSARIYAVYHVKCDAAAVRERAETIALEQSVELPRAAVSAPHVIDEIIGEVTEINELAPSLFAVTIGLALATAPPEAGQLMNMLFGNTSLHEDVALADVRFPEGYAASFGGPTVGIEGLRAKTGAGSRALTASALKPQGLSANELAGLAGQLATGCLDVIKDDHGIADQEFSPFAERVPLCAQAVRAANQATGRRTLYAPSVTGSLDAMRQRMDIAVAEGLEAVLIAPMVVGLPSFQAIRALYPEVALLAHPAMAGAARILPGLLLGRLFRMFGADAVIFPNYGGRFSYGRETCRAIAVNCLSAWQDGDSALPAAAPTPAGGMTLARVPELLDFYGRDVMLLIGGSLLSAGDRLVSAAAEFQRRVETHGDR